MPVVGLHARRKFFDAVKLNPKDQTAIEIVALMDEFFAIDEEARTRSMTQTDRDALRQQRARPLLEGFRERARYDT